MESYERIRALRVQRGLSQEELAHKVGYRDRSSVAKVESGKVDLSRSKIILFANALGVTPADILGPDEEAPVITPEEQKQLELVNAISARLETATQEELEKIMAVLDLILPEAPQ